MNLKSHLAGWELNPIVIKELRQAVRSWAVTGMLLLFLAILFFTALTFLITQSFDSNANRQLGAEIFQVFTAILTTSSLIFIPLYIGIRLAAERQESNLDLLYITTLTPQRIIRGKFLCGAYMAVLFFSACMPFMVFTNLLRGVDLPSIFFILFCLFLVICAAVQVAIFLACLPISKVLKILVGLFAIFSVFSVIAPLVFFFFEMLRSGIGSMIGEQRFLMGVATTVGIALATVMLLYFLSVALISPLSANRALPLRVFLTVAWLLSLGASLAWVSHESDANLLLPWAFISFILFTMAIMVVVSNYDQLSLRVQKRIPRSMPLRALAFLFYNGAAGGLVWTALLLGATFAITLVGQRQFPIWFPGFSSIPAGEDLDEFVVTSSTVLLYVFAYALLALWIHRRFFKRRPPRLAGTLLLLLPAAWALIPNIVYFFLNRLSWSSLERLQFGNIFNLINIRTEEYRLYHLWFAAGWLLVMMVLNSKWFWHQITGFRPLERRAAPVEPAPAAVPPLISTTTGVPES